jgi:hypothetical protein
VSCFGGSTGKRLCCWETRTDPCTRCSRHLLQVVSGSPASETRVGIRTDAQGEMQATLEWSPFKTLEKVRRLGRWRYPKGVLRVVVWYRRRCGLLTVKLWAPAHAPSQFVGPPWPTTVGRAGNPSHPSSVCDGVSNGNSGTVESLRTL